MTKGYKRDATCVYCGATFVAPRVDVTYCSKECSRHAGNAVRRRHQPVVACVGCGGLFRQSRSNRRYCSAACCGRAAKDRANERGWPRQEPHRHLDGFGRPVNPDETPPDWQPPEAA